jgi:tetratricopeptide (TPR) repeat protein
VILGRVLVALKGIGSSEAGEMYMRAYELCQQVGDSHDLFAVLHGLYSSAQDYERTHTIAEQMLDLAENDANSIYRVSAHHLLGHTLMFMGELGLAQTHFERSLALYEPRHHLDFLLLCGQDEGIACMANQCMALWYLGYPDHALQRGQEAITLAEELAHPMSLSIAMHFVANLRLLRGEVQAAHRQIDAVLEVGSEQDFAFLLAIGTLYRGEALLREGQFGGGIAQIERAREALMATGNQGAELL